MRFSLFLVSGLLSVALATPIPKTSASKTVDSCAGAAVSAPAATASADASADTTADAEDAVATPVAAATGASGAVAAAGVAYNDFQISSGVGGDAEARANAVLASIDTSDLAAVSAENLKLINAVHDVAEDAEVGAFNPAIAAATGADADALQVGKIANKVLKLTAEVLAAKVKAAQGDAAAAEKATAEQKKLTKNIATDKASAGKASAAAPFTGSL